MSSENSASECPIQVRDLAKTYLIYNSPQDRLKQSLFRGRRNFFREFQALRDVSFSVGRGETVGIVGSNGSGKSTLLQIICGTVEPTRGECVVDGRISALLELGAGFNPEFTGRENVYLNGSILGLSPEEIEAKYPAIVAFSGIGDKIEQPVKTYSSGMYVRLAFAVAIASDPDILIVDEALAVGDEMFQRKCFARIRAIQERGGTILFVSHAAATVVEICDRAILLDKGELLLESTPKKVISEYHKLIFSPPEKAEAVRTRIKTGALPDKPTETCTPPPAAHYDAALVPESTVIYESRGVKLSNAHIETLSGEPVNLLTRGQEYVYSYEAEFTEAAEAVRFGMLMKTKSGLELGGAVTAPEGGRAEDIPAGAKHRVRFRFTCLLLPGVYFINCGCVGKIQGEETYLHRIIDACMFRVLPEEKLTATGIVDFLTKSEVL